MLNYFPGHHFGKGASIYSQSPTRGYHPTYNTGTQPYTSPVGAFAANGFGLYDLCGNVWEWCWDAYGGYAAASTNDPRGPSSGSERVLRGGGWAYTAYNCRVARRDHFDPTSMGRCIDVGFRCVLPK